MVPYVVDFRFAFHMMVLYKESTKPLNLHLHGYDAIPVKTVVEYFEIIFIHGIDVNI